MRLLQIINVEMDVKELVCTIEWNILPNILRQTRLFNL